MKTQLFHLVFIKSSEQTVKQLAPLVEKAGGQEVVRKERNKEDALELVYISGDDDSIGPMLHQLARLELSKDSTQCLLHSAELPVVCENIERYMELNQLQLGWEVLEKINQPGCYLTNSFFFCLAEEPFGLQVYEQQIHTDRNDLIKLLRVERFGSSVFNSYDIQKHYFSNSTTPAPLSRRIAAAITDYMWSVVLLFLFLTLQNIPLTLPVILSRKRIEAEYMDLDYAEIEKQWKASGIGIVLFHSSGSAKTNFPFAGSEYDITFGVSRRGDGPCTIQLSVGDETHTTSVPVFYKPIIEFNAFPDIKIETNDLLTLASTPPTACNIDYVQFYGNKDPRYPMGTGISRFYFDDLTYTLGMDKGSITQKILLHLTITAGLIFLLLHIVFLSFTSWTPGCLSNSIRIVTNVRTKPGFSRALLRALAYTASIPFFFLGWILPFISNQEKNWADMLSGTSVVEFRRGKNEK